MEDKRNYQRLIGCLLYLVHGTRPDIAYAVIQLSQFASKPAMHHWEIAKQVLRYLQGTKDARLCLGSTRAREIAEKSLNLIHRYFNAAHGNGIDRKSTCGYIFLYHESLVL